MKDRGLRTCLLLMLADAACGVLHRIFPLSLFLFAAISLLTAFYHYAMRLLVGKLSEKWFPRFSADPDHPWFLQKKWEPKLYKAIRLRYWKHRLPTAYPESYSLQNRTLEQIIQNTCHAELVHEIIAFLSFVPLLFSLIWGAFPVFAVTSVIAAGSDLLFAMLQRYNRPRLQKALSRRK